MANLSVNICGVEFKTTYPKKIYCSKHCRLKASNMRNSKGVYGKALRKAKCPICGKKFETLNPFQIYCSPKCKGVQYYAKATKREANLLRKCEICGAEFVTDRYHHLYCSDKCRDIGYEKFAYKPRQPVEKTCKHCGKKFIAEGGGQQKYCSEECRKRYWLKEQRAIRQRRRIADLPGIAVPSEKPVKPKKKFHYYKEIENRESEWSPENPKPVEPLSELERFKLGNRDRQQLMALEASECGLSYGKYKQALENGKTYEELKAKYEAEKAALEETNVNFMFR